MCDWAVTYGCGQDQTPSFINTEVHDKCKKVISYYHYNLFETNPDVPISHTMRHLLSIADEVIGQLQPIKFVLVSAHDSTIAALQVFLGIHQDEVPPYASNLEMEYWADDAGELSIRFVLNGKPITIPHFNTDLVKLHEFSTWAVPRIQHCMEIPIY
jgi:acid phosphatase